MPEVQLLHQQGLRQGDPLSPLLFILAIDPLHRLLRLAAERNIINPLPGRELKLRVSLYADDAVLFANPIAEEIEALMGILHGFGDATGLKINLAKSSATHIRCEDINMAEVLQSFGGQMKSFPITYLGLSIISARLRLVHLQFVLDRIRARLVGWKTKLLTIAGRRVLVRAVLTSRPTFTLTALRVPKKLLKEIDKSRGKFLWAHNEMITGANAKLIGQRCVPRSSMAVLASSTCRSMAECYGFGGSGTHGKTLIEPGWAWTHPVMSRTGPCSQLQLLSH